jgi:hypothetical protein
MRLEIIKKINFFYIFGSFWYADLKNNFFKIKKIILMHFSTKSYLKNNRNHLPNKIFIPGMISALTFKISLGG